MTDAFNIQRGETSVFFHRKTILVHNLKTIQGIWMDLYRDVDPDDQARCTQMVLL